MDLLGSSLGKNIEAMPRFILLPPHLLQKKNNDKDAVSVPC